MQPEHLRPELRVTPESHGVAVAFLDLVSWRSRMVAEMREETGAPTLTLSDLNVMLHVFVFDGDGSREADIIHNLRVPRRTVRDSLSLWERLGMIAREGHLYYPTADCAELFNRWFPDHFRLLSNVCSGFAEYRKSIGR